MVENLVQALTFSQELSMKEDVNLCMCTFSSFFPIHMIETLSMPSHSLKKFP
jgi:hypothetical protein